LKLFHSRFFFFGLFINVYFNVLCWTKLVICQLLVALLHTVLASSSWFGHSPAGALLCSSAEANYQVLDQQLKLSMRCNRNLECVYL